MLHINTQIIILHTFFSNIKNNSCQATHRRKAYVKIRLVNLYTTINCAASSLILIWVPVGSKGRFTFMAHHWPASSFCTVVLLEHLLPFFTKMCGNVPFIHKQSTHTKGLINDNCARANFGLDIKSQLTGACLYLQSAQCHSPHSSA